MKIAILASGNGTNAQAIIDHARDGCLDVEIACIISNNPSAGVLARAAKAGIPARVFERSAYSLRRDLDAAIVTFLQATGCELIVLAGYMLVIGPEFVAAYRGRILNIHPALLPAFPGTAGISSAYAYGARITGVSVHYVVEDVDAGPLIIQAAIPIRQAESLEQLEQRVHAIEHRIYPQAIQWCAEGRLSCEGRKVLLAPGSRRQQRQPEDWLVYPPLEAGF